MPSQREIDDFILGRRVVLLGVSVTPSDYSRVVLRTLTQRGHDVIPVRPGVTELDGRRVYETVFDVPGDIDSALLMTPSHHAERIAYECIERGILRLWFDPGGQRGVNDQAVELAEEHECIVLTGGNPLAEGLMRRFRRDTARRVSRAA